MSSNQDTFIAPPSTPGGSTTVTLWDSTWDVGGKKVSLSRRSAYPMLKRAVVRIFMDQNATFLAQDLTSGSSTFRTYNNGGAGDAITANTWFEKDVLLTSHDHKLAVTTGTAPTIWEVSIRLSKDRALGQ